MKILHVCSTVSSSIFDAVDSSSKNYCTENEKRILFVHEQFLFSLVNVSISVHDALINYSSRAKAFESSFERFHAESLPLHLSALSCVKIKMSLATVTRQDVGVDINVDLKNAHKMLYRMCM